MKLTGDGPLLVMWSGGIDSTLVLYEALKQGRHVRAHHIHLASSQGRAAAEERAVAQIVRWLDAQQLPGTLELTRSTTDFGDLHRVLDVKVWSWWIGVILAYERDIRQVATTQHQDSFRNASYRRRSMQVRKEMPALAGRRGQSVKWLSPLADMTKAEIVEATPGGLLELCWWCRTPDPAGRPCHECHTCRQVDAVLDVDPEPDTDEAPDHQGEPHPPPAEPPAEVEGTPNPPTDEPAPLDVVDDLHVGAGWYQLPDGVKVRGRQNALDALGG